jgi:CubicO group peptidase (beta-lactamase class C family)
MKRIILLIAGILITTLTHAQLQKANARIDSLLEYYNQTFDYNGVAFVSLKGKKLLKKGYGYSDRYKNIRNKANNVFMIGSITKQFTAELILMLAKENKLDLQDKLSKYYPDFPSGDKITIEHLLTHTAGLYNYTEDTLWKKHPTMSLSHEQMIDIFKNKPLEFEPGSKFEYCNSGYILLTYIIEKVSGKPYTVFARERIIAPLGMTHSGFDFANLKSKDKVACYEGVIIDSFYVAEIEDSTQSLGAGAMYSTVDDLYKWHRALQSYKLLDKEWQQKAYKIYKDRYGYGWFIANDFCGQKVLAHSGGISGFYTHFTRVEKEDLCISLLANVRSNGIDLNEISKNIIRCLYDTAFKIPAIRKEINLTPGVLKKLEGEYVLAADTSISISFSLQGKYLYFTVTGQPRERAYPQSQHLFFVKTADVQFEFVTDEKGKGKVLLYQNGEKLEALLRDM